MDNDNECIKMQEKFINDMCSELPQESLACSKLAMAEETEVLRELFLTPLKTKLKPK